MQSLEVSGVKTIAWVKLQSVPLYLMTLDGGLEGFFFKDEKGPRQADPSQNSSIMLQVKADQNTVLSALR